MVLGVGLGVFSWLRNAEISKSLKLRTKGTRSSTFDVVETVSHRCHLPLCRALLQLDIRRGGGRGVRWPLGGYCVYREALFSHTFVCVCVGGWGHVSLSWIPRKESTGIIYKVLGCPNCLPSTAFWAQELRFWKLLMPWDVGKGAGKRRHPREGRPGEQPASPLLGVAKLCSFSVF